MQETLERKSIKNIDFNCDLGQAYGIYKNNSEFELLDYVSSVNISCGFHAGDPVTIKEALLKAKEKNVAIGAHIGFNDIQGFGYRPVELKEDELEALVVYQIGALMSFAKAYGVSIEHVRPHGAMYKMAGEDFTFSCALAKTSMVAPFKYAPRALPGTPLMLMFLSDIPAAIKRCPRHPSISHSLPASRSFSFISL